jgi:hypothetical protein
MNKILLKEIVAHIYANFALIPSDFVNLNQTASLMGPDYILQEKITFEEEKISYSGTLSGCQMSLSLNELKVLAADCTTDKEFPEYAMIVQPKDAPTYGLYLIQNDSSEPEYHQPMLAVSINQGKDWMQLNTGLQATFLAAMEQARDLHMIWKKIENYKPQYQALISFLKFHADTYGI